MNTLRGRNPGTLVFVASGNDAHSDGIGLPACIASAVSVGAVWDSDVGGVSFSACTDFSTSADQIACFSNSGPNLDLLAPGGYITAPGVGGSTSSMVGTSQATPHAAGAAALLIESNPSLTPDAIENGLKGSGRTITDSRNGRSFTRFDVFGAWLLVP
jgi:subtilisin family serine protease